MEYYKLIAPWPSGIFATEGVINLVFNIVEGAITVLLYM